VPFGANRLWPNYFNARHDVMKAIPFFSSFYSPLGFGFKGGELSLHNA
jgi:hypothetical protein